MGTMEYLSLGKQDLTRKRQEERDKERDEGESEVEIQRQNKQVKTIYKRKDRSLSLSMSLSSKQCQLAACANTKTAETFVRTDELHSFSLSKHLKAFTLYFLESFIFYFLPNSRNMLSINVLLYRDMPRTLKKFNLKK